jgi:hypothetical protein
MLDKTLVVHESQLLALIDTSALFPLQLFRSLDAFLYFSQGLLFTLALYPFFN